jgi:hypothetical protein
MAQVSGDLQALGRTHKARTKYVRTEVLTQRAGDYDRVLKGE